MSVWNLLERRYAMLAGHKLTLREDQKDTASRPCSFPFFLFFRQIKLLGAQTDQKTVPQYPNSLQNNPARSDKSRTIMEQNGHNDRSPTPGSATGDLVAEALFATENDNDTADDSAAFERDVDAEFRRLVEEHRQRNSQRAAACRHRRVVAAARARYNQYRVEQLESAGTANDAAQATVNDSGPSGGRRAAGHRSPSTPEARQRWGSSLPRAPPVMLNEVLRNADELDSLIGLSPAYRQALFRVLQAH